MKRICFSILFFFFAISSVFSSPLLFKVNKELTANGVFELGVLDTARFRQVRIGIKVSKWEGSESKAIAEIELNAGKREMRRNEELLSSGVVSKAMYDRSVERVKAAQIAYDKAQEIIYPAIGIYGLENGEEILLAEVNKGNVNTSILIDIPPSKISVKGSGKGTYSIYIWGQ
jgi:hypothetical protein